MRCLVAGLLMVWALVLSCAQAWADKRVALVIANARYQNVTALINPPNDATAMADMFKRAAFDVVEGRRDLSNADMRRALRDFTDKARDADIAIIYYAGHGIEIDGMNYLIPVDAKLERDTDAFDEAISLERILQGIEAAKKLRLVILDACRDNPFARTMKRTVASRSLGRGLAGVEPSRPNTLIAFAAKGGSTAADGDTNSPFALALLKHMTAPGVELGKALRLVRDEVMSMTDNRQEPFVYGSLGGADIVLVPAPTSSASANPQLDFRRDYELAERIGTMEAWDFFLSAHPAGFYSDLARAQRNKLDAEQARQVAVAKAREAFDERERLAAQDSKDGELAKATAEANKADEARRDAEQRKAATEANLIAVEQAKKIERERLESERRKGDAATEEQAEKGSLKKADVAVIAALTPPKIGNETPLVDVVRRLQVELQRVGCRASEEVSDAWTSSARRSLAAFNNHAKTNFDTRLASLDALEGVSTRQGRVCPLECDRGFRASQDRCVKIVCESGQVLGKNGTCQTKPIAKPVVAQTRARAPSTVSRGSKCFVFNGRKVCE